MGTCDLCGQDAGFLRKRHKACEARRNAGWDEMLSLVAGAVLASEDATTLELRLTDTASRSFLVGVGLKPAYVAGWERAVAHALDDDVLTQDEESALVSFAQSHGLAQADLDGTGAYSRVVRSAALRDVLEGKVPRRLTFEGDLPFNLQKSETLVWVFPGTRYYEQRTKTRYVGGMQGFSVRVAKGLYYRAGGFAGQPVRTTESVDLGTGLLGVTDKHIYFSGPDASFRVKYDKIVAFTPYSDGIGIQRDAQTAKPQSFLTGDGWFAYNLITNLAKGVLG